MAPLDTSSSCRTTVGPITFVSREKKAKSVTFKETVAARKTIHINDYTDEEIVACWLTHKENETIQKRTQLEVSKCFKNEESEDVDYQCSLGKISFASREKKTKSVTFKPTVAARKTIHINNYTAEEIFACWWTDEEHTMIQKRTLLEASALLETEVTEEADYQKSCFRGLELYVKHIAEKGTAHKDAALRAVLQEQSLQREEGSYDPEYIAEIYQDCTSLAREKASFSGVKDSLEVSRR